MPDKTFVILAPSARFGHSNCFLGEGATESAAWADAYGPKPWTPYAKRCAKRAWCEAVDEAELADLHWFRANDV